MKTKYVPILRWKAGEQNCLKNLFPNILDAIIPFIEVSTPTEPSKAENAEKKYSKLIHSFNTVLPEKPFYLYLTEDWYNDLDDANKIPETFKIFLEDIDHPQAIPAFDLTDELNISNISNLKNENGVCLRVTINSFEYLGEILEQYRKNSWITPETTDLLIDLKYIDKEIYPKKAALATVLTDIIDLTDYRNVIIASCSFPKDVSSLQSNIVNEFPRHESQIHSICLKLQQALSFHYIYSDYGPANLYDTPFIRGMIPNFKIKYSTPDKYLVVKGFSIKKGGLDLINVSACCKLLMTHPQYSGASFSYGDQVIADTASGENKKSGNLTNWVGYSFNHHITLIVSIL